MAGDGRRQDVVSGGSDAQGTVRSIGCRHDMKGGLGGLSGLYIRPSGGESALLGRVAAAVVVVIMSLQPVDDGDGLPLVRSGTFSTHHVVQEVEDGVEDPDDDGDNAVKDGWSGQVWFLEGRVVASVMVTE